MRFQPLEKLINLHDHYTRQFQLDHRRLLLLQRRGELYLVEARCPHREHPLESAAVEAGIIECPLHRYRFALADGRVLQAGEEPCRPLRTYEVVYEGNEVGLMLEED